MVDVRGSENADVDVMKDIAIATSAYVLTRWVERSGPLMLPTRRGHGDFDTIRLGAVCGLAKWCHNAELLLREPALQHFAEIFVLTNNISFVRRECLGPVRIAEYSKAVHDAVMAFGAAEERRQRMVAQRNGIKRGTSAGAVRAESQLLPPHGAVITLLKWGLIGETRYKAMLIAELDVDLFHQGHVMSRVPFPLVDLPTPRTTAEALRDASSRFPLTASSLVAQSDVATPINAGTIFLKPNQAAFEKGLALLRSRTFSPQSGWNRTGRPRAVLASDFVVAPECRIRGTSKIARACAWWPEDTWNFIGGNADQGLLATVFLRADPNVRAAVRSGTRFGQRRQPARKRCLLGACHFGGRDKPWLLHFTRCLRWFDFLDNLTRAATGTTTTAPAESETSACVPWLRAQRQRALSLSAPRWDPCGRKVNECIL